MKDLQDNWLTDGWIDFEYKKYMLLGYLQEVSGHFKEHKLYPFFSDLLTHYKNLVSFKENKDFTEQEFPKRISRIDFEKMKIEFEQIKSNDEYMAEIESIIEFAIPQMILHLDNGKEIYEAVEKTINIFPVGLMPLNAEFGYMMLKENAKRHMLVYEYEMTIYESLNEKYRAMKTNYIGNYQYSISSGYEYVKLELIRSKPELPNPATYAIESQSSFPLVETFLPIAKRSLMKYILQQP